MQSYRLRITPLSAFATELLGDTLFGQLCWAIHNRYGKSYLHRLLQDYTDNKPFAVVSNAFPSNMIPCPHLPAHYFAAPDDSRQLKILKKRIWLPLETVNTPLAMWQQHSKSDDDINTKQFSVQAHNTINRLSETTGTGAFAPYVSQQYWYKQGKGLDIYVLLDETQCNEDLLKTCFEDIACFGYGADASIGMGKYRIHSFERTQFPQQENANAYLTLAPCVPQGLDFDPQQSFYQLFSRFGRHGDIAAHAAKPFKNPILMTQAGGVFSSVVPKSGFIGQGLGGEGRISKSIKTTVHQGYAPVIAIHLPALTE